MASRTVDTAPMACPRWYGYDHQSYQSEPPECLNCGWYDQGYKEVKVALRHDRWGSGSTQRLRYAGFSEAMVDVTMDVRTKAAQGRNSAVIIIPTCPFTCGLDMEVKSVSGLSNRKGEMAFACENRHHVRILRGADGDWNGWR